MTRNSAMFVVVALLAGGCAAPAQMSSNKAANYAKEPKRVYVMTDVGSDWGTEYYDAFRKKLVSVLAECGTVAQVNRISNLELDDNAHVRRAIAFNADSLLSIRRNGGTKNQYGTIINVDYDSRLVDVSTKQSVWRSNAHFIRGLAPIADRGQQLAVDITNRMKQDGIFHSCAIVKIPS